MKLFLVLQSVRIFETWEQGWRSGESTRLPPMCPGFDSWTRRHMWVEFVVGSHPRSERFFLRVLSFSQSPQKNNISKFQLDLYICQALYHEPLARVIAQALPVFDIYMYIYILHVLYCVSV